MSDAAESVFVDTNVLIYSVDTATEKYSTAREWMTVLWSSGRGRLSWQVLNEFYYNAVRKVQMPSEEARQVVLALAFWRPVDMSTSLLERAWHWADQANLSHWDALIVAAAEVSGCRWLLTEDLQDGRIFGSIQVVDPFRIAPEELGFAGIDPTL